MTDSELRERAVADLVAEQRRSSLFGGFAVLALVLLVVWGVTGAGYFWPVWPILGCLVAFAVVALVQGWSNRAFAETTVRQRAAHLSGQAPPGIQR